MPYPSAADTVLFLENEINCREKQFHSTTQTHYDTLETLRAMLEREQRKADYERHEAEACALRAEIVAEADAQTADTSYQKAFTDGWNAARQVAKHNEALDGATADRLSRCSESDRASFLFCQAEQTAKQPDPEAYRHKEYPDEAERLAQLRAKHAEAKRVTPDMPAFFAAVDEHLYEGLQNHQAAVIAEAEAQKAATNDGECAEQQVPVSMHEWMESAFGVLIFCPTATDPLAGHRTS